MRGQDSTLETLVQFRNRSGKYLRGMIHLPRGTTARRRVPGVIFLHGFTGDRMESHWVLIKCARALAQAGIATLRFDFYGSGESEGEFREATLRSELADAQSAAEFFRGQKGIDRGHLGLCGLSLGGAIAASLARRLRVQVVVLWSAVAHLDIFRGLASTLAKAIPGSQGALEYDAREISPHFFQDPAKTEPVKLLSRFKGPTLIIHPEKDDSVPLTHAEDFYQASRATHKEIVIIPGADHTFTSIAWESEVIKRTVGWFQKYL